MFPKSCTTKDDDYPIIYRVLRKSQESLFGISVEFLGVFRGTLGTLSPFIVPPGNVLPLVARPWGFNHWAPQWLFWRKNFRSGGVWNTKNMATAVCSGGAVFVLFFLENPGKVGKVCRGSNGLSNAILRVEML